MRIVHVTTVPQSLGFLRGQVSYVRERGFEVHAISSPGKQLGAFGELEGIPVHSVDLPRRITPILDLQAIWKLTQILRRIRPTIVHAHTPKGGLLAMIAASLARIPVRIYHIHGFPYMTAVGPRRRLLRTTERVSSFLATQVLAVSNSIREVAIADGICSQREVKVLAGGSINGVDSTNQFNPDRFSIAELGNKRAELGLAETALVIGYVGRIVRDKGIEELAYSWRLLRDRNPTARLVIVGLTEPQDPVSEETLSSLRQDTRVIMTGLISDTSEYYALFDLLVLPTHREGFGLVATEAAAMELPVVATDIPGCVDAVQNGVTGTLVPARDANALANAIQMYLDDPELRRLHGEAGRERVLRDFRQEVIWEAVYQEYCQLLREKELPVPNAPEPSPSG